MPRRYLLLLLFVCFAAIAPVCAQTTAEPQATTIRAADTTAQQPDTIADTGGDGMELPVLLIMGCVIMGLIFIGMLIGAGLLFLLFVLIAMGIFSVSVAAGLYRRSFLTGFRFFIVIIMTFLGCIAGTGGLLFLNILLNLNYTKKQMLLAGGGGGLVGGALLGITINALMRYGMKLIQNRMDKKTL